MSNGPDWTNVDYSRRDTRPRRPARRRIPRRVLASRYTPGRDVPYTPSPIPRGGFGTAPLGTSSFGG